jgi:hypothetical protein
MDLMRRLAVLTALFLVVAAPAQASPSQESTFQDDNLLVYNEPEGVAKTLDTLKALGVDRIRASVFWKVIAPSPASAERPEFDAADPAAYGPDAFTRYDTLLRLALERGLKVNWNVTSPAPNWATGNAERADIDHTFDPSPREFNLFVRALGTRYSGQYALVEGEPPIPRVDYWSVWNEPNQGGWLTPQWAKDPRDPKQQVETSPRIYRALVDAMYDGLQATGHEKDTILVGETAPKGLNVQGTTRAMKPARFMRQLFCLDDNLQFLQGSSAELRGCPVSDPVANFPKEHPGLFSATGWSHHPYELTFAPDRKPQDPEFFTIANLDDLSNLLRRIYDRYGRPRPGGGALYLTEFGYQTNPPDPIAVTLKQQSVYLNHSEFLAWRNPRVRTLSQFLLVDDKPLPGYPRTSVGAWGGTFQSGLMTLSGDRKPSFESYQLPIHVPRESIKRGSKLRVWGMVRVAENGKPQKVDVLIKAKGSKRAFRRIKSVTTNDRGYLDTRFAVNTSGFVRLSWASPGGRVVVSRSARYFVKKPVVKKKKPKKQG